MTRRHESLPVPLRPARRASASSPLAAPAARPARSLLAVVLVLAGGRAAAQDAATAPPGAVAPAPAQGQEAGPAPDAAPPSTPPAPSPDAAPAASAEPPGPAVGLVAPPEIGFRGHLEWISAAGGALMRSSPVNPDNRMLRLPSAAAESEMRPDLRLSLGSQLSAVVRPRLLVQVQRARIGGDWTAEDSDARAEWIEGYATWRLADRLAVSYGRQNFQWGPADLVSPSNRIFHATGFLRDPLYVVRGRDLARANVSFGREWSAVVLAEVTPNGEAPFVAEEPFDPKAQVKIEYAAPSGDAYAAVVLGASRRSRAWFGEYGTLPLVEGLAAYVDAVHTVGRRAWYPVDDGAGGVTFAQTGMETRALRTTALAGLRYSFVNGADVRLEYLYDEAGWGDGDLALAQRAAAADPALAGRYLDPGFEVLGRHSLYAAWTFPDLPPHDRTKLQARYLYSLTDGSGAAFVTASYDATDSVVAFVSVSATHGPSDGALSRLSRGTAVVGVNVNW